MEIILKYFPDLTEEQRKQFAALYDLYIDWNAKINVISRKDIENLYEHHVLHSLGIAKVIQFRPGTKVMDLGTGGGFPGIPLAILFPETKFHLVDSIGKKVRVATEVANAIGLKNVTFRHDAVLRNYGQNLQQRSHTHKEAGRDVKRSKYQKSSFHPLRGYRT